MPAACRLDMLRGSKKQSNRKEHLRRHKWKYVWNCVCASSSMMCFVFFVFCVNLMCEWCLWVVCGWWPTGICYILYIFSVVWPGNGVVCGMVGNIISVVCPTANVCIQIRVSLFVWYLGILCLYSCNLKKMFKKVVCRTWVFKFIKLSWKYYKCVLINTILTISSFDLVNLILKSI